MMVGRKAQIMIIYQRFGQVGTAAMGAAGE